MNAPALKIALVATLEDLLAIPEEARRHELIDGVIVEKGAASGEHGGVQRRLSARIDPFERRPGGRWPGGWWFATEVDVYFDPANTFRPDVAGWRRERAPERWHPAGRRKIRQHRRRRRAQARPRRRRPPRPQAGRTRLPCALSSATRRRAGSNVRRASLGRTGRRPRSGCGRASRGAPWDRADRGLREPRSRRLGRPRGRRP